MARALTEVMIGKMRLANPVMVASGTFGEPSGALVDPNRLGAYVAKTITFKARLGNPPPRVAETAAGMLNSIGLENKGVDDFLRSKMPFMRGLSVPVVVSIAAEDPAELKALARRLAGEKRIDALEVNLSCPNVSHGNRKGLIAQDPEATRAFIATARTAFARTVIAKLTPNVSDITVVAHAAEAAGADAIVVANTFLGMAIDIETQRPKLGKGAGGLSGPAIKPIALRMVFEAARAVGIPVIGCGGIMDADDAIEYILAGATAIQVGTANFVDPQAPVRIIEGIEAFLKRKKADGIAAIRGAVRLA